MSLVRVWTGIEWRVMSGGAPDMREPTPPRDLAITAVSGGLEIAWQEPYDNGGSPITGYRLTVNPGNIIQNLASNVFTTAVGGLSNGTPYSISLIAINAIGDSPAIETVASPTGPWVMGGTGALVGAPDGWGGNNGVNNLRGAYAATAPPAGVTNGYQMGPQYCGVLPVLQSQNKDYTDLTPVTTIGTFYDATGTASGVITYGDTTDYIGINVTRNGAILEYLDIQGQVFINANNVIIRYCRIDGRPVTKDNQYLIKTYRQKHGLIVSYCELISGTKIGAILPPYGEYTARFNNCWNIGADAFKVGANTLVEYNWVHHLKKAPLAHADGSQWTSEDNVMIQFNRFDMYEGPDDVPPYQLSDYGNAAIILGNMTGDGTWFAFYDNYGDGCGFTLRVGQPSPDAKGWITQHAYWRRNRVGRRFLFGPYSSLITPGQDQIIDETNVWHDSGMTYRLNKNNGRWYEAGEVVADTPIVGWEAVTGSPVT